MKIHYLTFDLDLGVPRPYEMLPSTLYIIMTYVVAKFKAAKSNGLGDEFTRKYNI